MSSQLVLGIDCSTTACKALVFDSQGKVISAGRESIPTANPIPGWFEQCAGDWCTALLGAIRQAVAEIDSKKLAALCITHQRETFVPVDPKGIPIGPAIVWLDERSRSLLPELKNILGADRFHQITGKPVTGNLTISKIAWLRKNEPDIFGKAGKFLDVQAYLVHFLTGLYRTSSGSAGPMGLFDIEQNRWSDEILTEFGLQINQLPETYPPGEILGKISPSAAKICNLPAGLPVISGIGDGQAIGIGANITRPEDAYLSLGTSVIGGYISERYRIGNAFRTMISAIPATYFLETVLLGGAYTISWFMDNFVVDSTIPEGFSKEQWLDETAHNIPAGSEGLLCVPYWNSVMNPYWDAFASGIVVGWRGNHTPQHLYRAILEGIAFEVRLHMIGVETALGRKLERYFAVGGGAKSEVWCQIIADVTGIKVHRTKHPETAALGAGIIAAAGAGIYENAAVAARAMATLEPVSFEPNSKRHKLYREIFQDVYLEVYPALQEPLRRLVELQGQHSA
jgi:xylulokinase